MASQYGILIDYAWCTGCHSCEFACQMEHGFPIGQSGILMKELGPWQIEGDVWQYDYIAVPTDQCDFCADRRNLGKSPSCVQHCQAACIEFGPLEELFEIMKSREKVALIRPRAKA